MKRRLSILLSVLLCLSLAISVSALSTIKVSGIKLDKSSISLDVGKTYDLKVTFSPANTTQKGLIFTTSDKNVAAVDTKGKITAKKAGKAVITVTSSTNKKILAKCNITVSQGIDTSKFVTVSYLMLGDPPATDQVAKVQAKWNAIMKQKINANMNLQWVEWADWQTKYALLLASGQPLDLVTTGTWLDTWNEAQKGAFMNLDNLLPKYAPNTWAEVPKEDWDQSKYNGMNPVPGNVPLAWIL